MHDEVREVAESRPARSCQDIKLEQPYAHSGTYTIDPNLGSRGDAIKSYCDFDAANTQTCVTNGTSFAQINYLHLLHTHSLQNIQLPCSAQGPFR